MRTECVGPALVAVPCLSHRHGDERRLYIRAGYAFGIERVSGSHELSAMSDPRFARLAEVPTGFSTELKKGESVLIDAFDVPDAFTIALVRAAQ